MELGQAWEEYVRSRKCGRKIGKYVGVWAGGKTWGRYERVYGVSVEVMGKCRKVCRDVGRCGKMWGAYTLFYTFLTPSTLT